MSGTLTHSPAHVIVRLLRKLGYVAAPGGTWPGYVSVEPDEPDNCVTLFDTEGRREGRNQVDGEIEMFHGLQVRVRSEDYTSGYVKANAIAIALDTEVLDETVTIDSTTYAIHQVSRVGDVISLGKEVPNGKRDLFTINAVAVLQQS